MLRTNPTLRSAAVLIVLLVICCAGGSIIRTNMSRPSIAGGRMPGVYIQWSLAAKDIRFMTFSPSGQHVCTVSRDGRVDCYTSDGGKCFSTNIPGADRVLVAPDGSCFVAYSHLNPMNAELTFLDSNGRVHWRMDVSGAVWSADASECDGGSCFAVGTGGKHVYLITIDGRRKRYRRWRTPGVVPSVAFAGDRQDIIFGTWQDSAVSRTTLNGRRIWENDADSASLQYAQSLGASDRLFLQSVPNNSGDDAQVSLLTADGETLWRNTLDSSRHMRALPSPDGRYICIGYDKLISHNKKSMREKHAELLDDSGRQIWDKGSLFFPASPVMVIPGGYVLVSSGGTALFAISPVGDLKKVCSLPAAIVDVQPARDNSQALIRCANGRIYLLKVSQ